MERFVGDLSHFAEQCKGDILYYRKNGEKLDDQFKTLQKDVKKTFMENNQVPQKIVKAKSPPKRIKHQTFVEKPPNTQQERKSSMIFPAPFPVKHYAFPIPSNIGAKRFYKPKAKEWIMEQNMDLLDDISRTQDKSLLQVIGGQIDPSLHIGSFHPSEMKKQ